jgi:antitoxin (DNA-binding transcriptional repressor) of toxin-antitoxin stability system
MIKRIDLDDLPPRVAQILESLDEGEELILARGGGVVGRLKASEATQPAPTNPVLADLAPEERMSEVLDHFSAIINDEF